MQHVFFQSVKIMSANEEYAGRLLTGVQIKGLTAQTARREEKGGHHYGTGRFTGDEARKVVAPEGGFREEVIPRGEKNENRFPSQVLFHDAIDVAVSDGGRGHKGKQHQKKNGCKDGGKRHRGIQKGVGADEKQKPGKEAECGGKSAESVDILDVSLPNHRGAGSTDQGDEKDEKVTPFRSGAIFRKCGKFALTCLLWIVFLFAAHGSAP